MIKIIKVDFYKEYDNQVYIRESGPGYYQYYNYRKSIADLFDINITKLTKILTEKYNAKVYGGKKFTSYFYFNKEDTEKVKEYFESLIIMKELTK